MDKLKASEEQQVVHEAKNIAAAAATDQQSRTIKAMEEASHALESVSIANVLPSILIKRPLNNPDPCSFSLPAEGEK